MTERSMTDETEDRRLVRVKVVELGQLWIPRAGFWEPDFQHELAKARRGRKAK